VIFAARGLLVSLAFFAMLYCSLSLVVVLIWQGVKRIGDKYTSGAANFLFGLRISPFATSLLITLFFTIPSFWLMERASPDEDGETFFLALCAVIILSAGLLRLLRAQAKTTRAISQWATDATSGGTSKLRASSGAPPLILVGIRKPQVMVSDTVSSVLSEDELQVAIHHELGHMRSRDNLKKLLISATPFPGMNSLNSAWREAAELAADDSAVSNRQEALDLAAALIKLSKSSHPEPAFASGLVSGSSSIGLRVERLLGWNKSARRAQCGRRWMSVALLTILACIVCNYGATLALTHRLTELLVP
jgi:beta-lactamase regulating signal transducer with metallopeptidase domain